MIIPQMISFYLLAFTTGIIMGSFLNVLIYRLPRELSFVKGFSMCTSCAHRLMPLDLIPLFSWLFLKGKCRYCGEKISPRYPMVECLVGVLFTFTFIKFGATQQTIIYCAIAFCLVGVAFTDWEHMIIPDTYSVIMTIVGLWLLLIEPELRIERLIGAVSVSGLFLLIVLLSRGRAMGVGDIKLMASLGLCLGVKQIIFVMFFGAVLGSVTFLILKFTKSPLGREVPFGTFLAIAGIFSIFAGLAFITWYTGLINVHYEHDGHMH